MDQNSEKLIKAFKSISKKGWVKSTRKGWGGVGLTFEHEIGKMPDSQYLPDYNGIELKCASRYSRYPMYLFTVAFDSNENEIIRLANEYGYSDQDYPDKKVLFRKITNAIIPGNKYNFCFRVDRNDKKIYLEVYSDDGILLEDSAYVTFESLKKHIETKLSRMAYINASKKVINEIIYYRYYHLKLYTNKGFEKFLTLLESNMLVITLIARISKCGEDKGRYKNKNVVFAIRKDNIDKLFDCYYDYDCDDIKNQFNYNFKPF